MAPVAPMGPPVGPPQAPIPYQPPLWRFAPSPGGILEPTRYYFATPGFDERRSKRRRFSLIILLSLVVMCGILGCATGILVTVVRARRGQREMVDGETAVQRQTEPALRLDRSWGSGGGLVDFMSLLNQNMTSPAIMNNVTLDTDDETSETVVELGHFTKAVLPESGVEKGGDAIDAASMKSARRSCSWRREESATKRTGHPKRNRSLMVDGTDLNSSFKLGNCSGHAAVLMVN
ncbi:hypothetical protein MTO96_039785 [Rhipicephalus appendiculatus]